MKARIIVVIILVCMIFSGCWDKKEIEDRAYVGTLGIDVVEENIELTYSTPNVSVITGQGSGEETKFTNSFTGQNIIDAEEKFEEKTGLILSLDHIKMIILGKEFMESEKHFKKAVDYFARNSNYAKSTLIVGSIKTAKELTEATPKTVKLTGEYISQLINKETYLENNPYYLNIGELIVDMYHRKGLEIIPIVLYENEEIILNGVDVVKDYKRCCHLTRDETIIYEWLLGKGKRSIVNFEYEDQQLSYMITDIRRIVNVSKEDDRLNIKIMIETEGDINTFLTEGKETRLDADTIQKVEEKINEAMQKEMTTVVKKIMDEVAKDVLYLEDDLKIHHQKTWIEIKENYDDYFTSAKLSVEADNKIRRIGMIQ